MEGPEPMCFLRILFARCSYGYGSKLKSWDYIRGFVSLVPFTKVPFWYRFFEPQPYLATLRHMVGGLFFT